MKFFEAFALWRKRATTFRELSKLTDRELQDLGLNRGDIRRVAFDQ